ncbi:MAG: ArgE/DapE family deacylase [Firmicutes bacterium]|nr:ArgE/DapE family deacylase [Bacillota bacterium]
MNGQISDFPLKRFAEFLDQRRNAHVDFLRRLIQTDTTVIGHGWDGGNEAAGQRLVRERLAALGCEIDEFIPDNDRLAKYRDAEGNLGHIYDNRPIVVGTYRGGNGRSLILNGHIDTMPVDSPEQWRCNPFGAEVVDGRVYGRGACDMKGGLAAAIMAVEALVEFGIEPKGNVIIQSVVDEEGGGNGTLAVCDRGYRADAAIITEPTNLEVRPAGMGFLLFEVTTSGRALHSSLKWQGVNAIEKAIKLIESLQELEHRWMMTRRHLLLPPPTINLGVIEGGSASSTVPDRCTFKICLHYLPTDDPDGFGTQVEQEIVDTLMQTSRGDGWLSDNPPVIRKYQAGAGFETSVDHPLVNIITEAFSEISGQRAAVTGCGFGCDARHVNKIAGTPTVVFGPGDPSAAHSVNEVLPLDQYFRAIEVLAMTIYRWTRS